MCTGPEWFGTSTLASEADRLIDTLNGLASGLWVAGMSRESYGVHISLAMREYFRVGSTLAEVRRI